MKKYTSAEAAKLLRLLNEEYDIPAGGAAAVRFHAARLNINHPVRRAYRMTCLHIVKPAPHHLARSRFYYVIMLITLAEAGTYLRFLAAVNEMPAAAMAMRAIEVKSKV